MHCALASRLLNAQRTTSHSRSCMRNPLHPWFHYIQRSGSCCEKSVPGPEHAHETRSLWARRNETRRAERCHVPWYTLPPNSLLTIPLLCNTQQPNTMTTCNLSCTWTQHDHELTLQPLHFHRQRNHYYHPHHQHHTTYLPTKAPITPRHRS